MKTIIGTNCRNWLSVLLLTAAVVPGLASAQVPTALEGPILSVTEDGFGGATMTVMGIDVVVPASIFTGGLVTSPSATITSPAQLGVNNLPGRAAPGFIGGTAIVNGSSTLAGGFIAADVFVEPAENVVIGLVTRPDGGAGCDILLEGVPLIFSNDARIPFGTAINASGFEILPCTVTAGGSVAVEGYFGDVSGSLHIFSFESDDATIVPNAGGTTTIARAQCDRGRLEVRGSSTLTSGSALILDNDSGVQLGSADLIFDAVTSTGSYRFRETIAGGTCPSNVRAESWDDFATNGGGGGSSSFAVAPVDIK